MSIPPSLPAAPDMVLRVGFAGNREMPIGNEAAVQAAIGEVLVVMAQRLAEIVKEAHDQKRAPKTIRFYSKNVPTLRLITGLAEGADSLAVLALGRLVNSGVKPEFAG